LTSPTATDVVPPLLPLSEDPRTLRDFRTVGDDDGYTYVYF
jgi:hypothetical protein